MQRLSCRPRGRLALQKRTTWQTVKSLNAALPTGTADDVHLTHRLQTISLERHPGTTRDSGRCAPAPSFADNLPRAQSARAQTAKLGSADDAHQTLVRGIDLRKYCNQTYLVTRSDLWSVLLAVRSKKWRMDYCNQTYLVSRSDLV